MKTSKLTLPRALSHLFLAIEWIAIVWAIALFTVLALLRFGGTNILGGAWGLDVALKLNSSAAVSMNQTPLNLDHVHATVPVQFSHAGGVIHELALPMAFNLLCKAAIVVALSDLFRRLFRQVDRGEVFAAENIRLLRRAGVTVIAFTLAGAFFNAMVQRVSDTYVKQHLSIQGAVGLETNESPRSGLQWSTPADWLGLNHPELLVGLILFGLAEALRQGLVLQEEQRLTV